MNAAKSATIGVLELLKFQNVFHSNHDWNKVTEVSRSYLNVPFAPSPITPLQKLVRLAYYVKKYSIVSSTVR